MNVTVEGGTKLYGSVEVSGAKNSATRILAASMLAEGEVVITNFPLTLEDVKAKINFMTSIGSVVEGFSEESILKVTTNELSYKDVLDYDVPIRTTYLLSAAPLARNSYARVPYPGGCKIGSRGYDMHVMVWKCMGCSVEEKADFIEITGSLKGAVIDFPISTIGGTENALMCAAVASGTTIIKNAYVSPEVNDLIQFLRAMGSSIELEGTSTIRVVGTSGLLKGTEYPVMPDRIEALTWIVLSAINGGHIEVKNVPYDILEIPLIHLRESGVDIFKSASNAIVSSSSVGKFGIQPFELACGSYPGVISDMQAFFVLLAQFASGRSIVYDYRYPERIAYAKELNKFWPGSISAESGKIVIVGQVDSQPAVVKSTDLRGSMALLMAALCVSGTNKVEGVELALRGYNNLQSKLKKIGAKCEWSK